MSLFKNKNLDLLAIGDTAVDAFIRLKDASVHCSIDNTTCELCMRFGDKIPFEFAEIVYGVGNSANAAVSASRLGLSVGLMSHLGDDEYASKIISYLNSQKINTSLIKKQKGKPTNYHYVLWYENERTILIKHTDFSYTFEEPKNKPKWLYLSSLGENTLDYHNSIIAYLNKNTDIKLAFQPGTFQIKLGAKKIPDLYKRSDVFICNKEEIQIIIEEKHTDIKYLLKKAHELGPKIVLITDGPKGAYAYDGKNMYFQPPYPDIKPPYERTGAGDAFASTFTSAICLGLSIEEALSWAPINSMSVVQYVGAQKGLLSKEKIKEYLKHAPSDYKAQKID